MENLASSKSKIKAFEIVEHGVDYPDYFQGCGTAFTDYDMAFTGVGANASEAYNDAVEQACQVYDDCSKLPRRPRGISARNRVKVSDGDDAWYYVSIRVR